MAVAGLLPERWGVAIEAAERTVRRQAAYEWWGTPLHTMAMGRLAATDLAASPRNFRPAEKARGREILKSRLSLAGALLDLRQDPNPWDTPSPSRRFAEALHRFVWLKDLLAAGNEGAREALRLTLMWERTFGRWSPFAWSDDVLGRRVYELACALKRLTGVASEEDRLVLLSSLTRQADHLSRLEADAAHAAENACAAAVAGLALSGASADKTAQRALGRLANVLPVTVLPDGGHRSRSPQAALELLLDLLTLDDVLLQRGREAPVEVARAIDRLGAAVRFFTLGDGRLACFQGGEASDPSRIGIARVHEDTELKPFGYAPHTRYQRMAGKKMLAVVDAGPPATGPWSLAACAQPLAFEVTGGEDRLITNSGWSRDANGPQALRLAPGGTTIGLGEDSPGELLDNWASRTLGARLVDASGRVDARRNESPGGVWIELAHDGWLRRYSVVHERRLFLDAHTDELRGEDRLVPSAEGSPAAVVPYVARFHLHPDTSAVVQPDGRSVVLTGASGGRWWFRNDAADVVLEPSVHFVDGAPQRTEQIVLRGTVRGDGGARVRWKLAPGGGPA